MAAAAYSWQQDTATVTVSIAVERGTAPEELRLLLTRRRLTLERRGGARILRRRLGAPVDHHRSRSWQLDEAGHVRVVLFKAAPLRAWTVLFVGDAQLQHLLRHPDALAADAEVAADACGFRLASNATW